MNFRDEATGLLVRLGFPVTEEAVRDLAKFLDDLAYSERSDAGEEGYNLGYEAGYQDGSERS